MIKNIIKISLVFGIVLSMCGCEDQQNELKEETNQNFEKFIAEIPAKIYTDDGLSVNQLFINPENYNIKTDLAEWYEYDTKNMQESNELFDTIFAELEDFDYTLLNETNQETYDVLEYAFSDIPFEISDENYYYLDNNPLGEFSGVYNDILMTLYFYSLKDTKDIESYINLIDTLDEYAISLLAFENERQTHGYGMSQQEIDDVIYMVGNMLETADLNFIVDDFINDTNEIEGLEEDKIESYQKSIKENAVDQIVLFYESILEGLEEIEPQYEEIMPLASLTSGQDYFASIVYSSSGFEDMDEYKTYIDNQFDEAIDEYAAFDNNLDLSKLYNGEVDLYTATSMNEVLGYLSLAMQEDFPIIEDINYQVESLPTGLRELMPNVGAFYMVGAVDCPDCKQQIVLNGDYQPTDFITLAHEGYPGHMYQHSYVNRTDLPMIRKILSFSDYTEGYANYVQRYATKYADNEELAEYYTAYERFLYFLILQMDYQINYLGLDAEDIFEIFFDVPKDKIKDDELYQQIVLTPGSFIMYYVAGSRFDDLHEKVNFAAHKDVSDREFHESILKHGNIPMNLLEKYLLKEYR